MNRVSPVWFVVGRSIRKQARLDRCRWTETKAISLEMVNMTRSRFRSMQLGADSPCWARVSFQLVETVWTARPSGRPACSTKFCGWSKREVCPRNVRHSRRRKPNSCLIEWHPVDSLFVSEPKPLAFWEFGYACSKKCHGKVCGWSTRLPTNFRAIEGNRLSRIGSCGDHQRQWLRSRQHGSGARTSARQDQSLCAQFSQGSSDGDSARAKSLARVRPRCRVPRLDRFAGPESRDEAARPQ